MKKHLMFSILIVFFVTVLKGQDNDHEYDIRLKPAKQSKAISSSVSLGSTFLNFMGENYLDTWIYPKINYQLNPKWSFTGGVLFRNSNFPVFYPVHEGNGESVPNVFYGRQYVTGTATFSPSKRMMISGTVVKEIGGSSLLQQRYEEYMLDLSYKITDYLMFQARFHMINSPGGMYYSSPWYMPGYF